MKPKVKGEHLVSAGLTDGEPEMPSKTQLSRVVSEQVGLGFHVVRLLGVYGGH